MSETNLSNYLQNCDLQSYVEEIVRNWNIPALSMAIMQGGRLYRGAAGILNMETGVEVTNDSIFQIGSITKVFTASLVMRLLEEGRVEFDAPVKRYLKDFHLADTNAANSITVRQLLNHTSGIAGDFFVDDTLDSNAIARYVDRCSLLPQIHSPGENFSYCNAAYAIAGRLVEVVSGISWHEAIEQWIFRPLGMAHAIAHPMEVLRFRAAMGHQQDPDNKGKWIPVRQCYLSFGQAPAGSTLSMSASDLVKFGMAHLNGGIAESGERWLSEASVKLMRTSQVKLPPHSPGFLTDWGLGWSLIETDACSIVGHDGATVGQAACLQLLPEHNIAIAIQVNNRGRELVLQKIFKDVLSTFTGVELKEVEPACNLESPERFTGRYGALGVSYEVSVLDGGLIARMVPESIPIPPLALTLKPIEQNIFAAYSDCGEPWGNVAFIDLNEEGIPSYFYAGLRVNPRV